MPPSLGHGAVDHRSNRRFSVHRQRSAPLCLCGVLNHSLSERLSGPIRDVPSLAESLSAYLDGLLELNDTLNLTAAQGPDEAVEILVQPSLGVEQSWPHDVPPGLVLDVGSGNGFPGVVAALLWPDARVLLVERRGKKAAAIRACLEKAGISNARVLACDVREVPREEPGAVGAVDLVTVRAVGELGKTTRMAAPLVAPGGRIVHWKASDLDDRERDEGARVAAAAGFDVLPEIDLAHGRGRLVIYAHPEDAV